MAAQRQRASLCGAVCILVLWAAAVRAKPAEPDMSVVPHRFEAGLEYVYEYRSDSRPIDDSGQLRDVDIPVAFTCQLRIHVVSEDAASQTQLCAMDVRDLNVATTRSGGAAIDHSADMSQPFFFRQSHMGEVVAVYHAPSENADIVNLKKGILSAFVHRAPPTGSSDGPYETEERDHGGEHMASYTIGWAPSPPGRRRSVPGIALRKVKENPDPEYLEYRHEKVVVRVDSIVHSVEEKEYVGFRRDMELRSTTDFEHVTTSAGGRQARESSRRARQSMPLRQPLSADALPEGSPMPDVRVAFESVVAVKLASSGALDASVRRRAVDALGHSHDMSGLVEDSIAFRKNTAPPADASKESWWPRVLAEVECLEARRGTITRESADCLGRLVKIARGLSERDLALMAAFVFDDVGNALLPDHGTTRRSAAMSALAHMGTPFAQDLLVRHGLINPLATAADVESFAVAVLLLREPTTSTVAAIAAACYPDMDAAYGESLEAVRARVTPDLRKSLVLALGALAGKLHRTDESAAATMARPIVDELSAHRETVRRSTRAIEEHYATGDRATHPLHLHEALLVEALGNAALPHTVDAIAERIGDASAPRLVQRSCVGALRQFEGSGVEEILATVVAAHEDVEVRVAGRKAFEHRVRSRPIDEATHALLDAHLRGNTSTYGDDYADYGEHHAALYDGVEVSRRDADAAEDPRAGMKLSGTSRASRSISDIINAGVFFQLAAPTVEYEKGFGNKDVGARASVLLRNRMQFQLSVLKTRLDIEIKNEASAEVYGFGRSIKFAEGRLNFVGYVGYDLNVVRSLLDLNPAKYFDMIKNIASNALQQVKDAGSKALDMINGFGGKIQDMFLKLVDLDSDSRRDADDSLPEVARRDIERIFEAHGLSVESNRERRALLPVSVVLAISKLKLQFDMLRQLLTGVKRVIKSFMDAFKTIKDSFATIKSAISQMTECPFAAVIWLGISVVSIVKAIFAAWISVLDLRTMWYGVGGSASFYDRWDQVNAQFDVGGSAPDGLSITEKIQKYASIIADKFLDGVYAIKAKIVNFGYQIKDIWSTITMKFGRLFSSKFNKRFPDKIRPCSADKSSACCQSNPKATGCCGPCGCTGIYPAGGVKASDPFGPPVDSAQTKDKDPSIFCPGGVDCPRPGVDLVVSPGQGIVAPFTGIVRRPSMVFQDGVFHSYVSIEGTTGSWKDWVVHILHVDPVGRMENGQPDTRSVGEVNEGQIIARAAPKHKSCQDTFIHVSMWKRDSLSLGPEWDLDDPDTEFADPTLYIPSRFPSLAPVILENEIFLQFLGYTVVPSKPILDFLGDMADKVQKNPANPKRSRRDDSVNVCTKELTGVPDMCMDTGALQPLFQRTELVFRVDSIWPVGPLQISFTLELTVTFGVYFGLKVCILSQTAEGRLAPRVAGGITLSVGVGIALFRGGIRLAGTLVDTMAIGRANISFTGARNLGITVDLEINPLTLVFSCFLEANGLLKWYTVFEYDIWKFQLATIKFPGVLSTGNKQSDPTPPVITGKDADAKGRRAAQAIAARQENGNEYVFEFTCDDPESGVDVIEYALGSSAGATDVLSYTAINSGPVRSLLNMTSSLFVFASVRATNKFGLQAAVGLTPIFWQLDKPVITVTTSPVQSHPSSMFATYTVTERASLDLVEWALGTGEGLADVIPWTKVTTAPGTTKVGGTIGSNALGGLLNHGRRYYFNVHARSIVGWESRLFGTVLVDFTPPVATPSFIFNGIDVGVRTDYTGLVRSVAASWQPFTDAETMVVSYAWSISAKECNAGDILPWKDPFGGKDPTSRLVAGASGGAFVKAREFIDVDLPEGEYFVSVRATNEVGLTTTVCSRNYIVDLTAPSIGNVYVAYDEDYVQLTVTWDAWDYQSPPVDAFYFGLGYTAGDDAAFGLTSYGPQTGGSLVIPLAIPSGVRLFPRVVILNRVALRTFKLADSFIIDVTPPEPGTVADGPSADTPRRFQSSNTTIAAAWSGFNDPETGIAYYRVVFGTDVGQCDPLTFIPLPGLSALNGTLTTNLSLSAPATLAHGRTYYAMVLAYNGVKPGQGRVKWTAVCSAGVRIDVTPPVAPPTIADGSSTAEDLVFQSSLTSIESAWDVPFNDPESDIAVLRASVRDMTANTSVNLRGMDSDGFVVIPPKSTSFANYNVQLVLGHLYVVVLLAENGAGGTTFASSDGVTVDNTPPIFLDVEIAGTDASKGTVFVNPLFPVTLIVSVTDPESRLKGAEWSLLLASGAVVMPASDLPAVPNMPEETARTAVVTRGSADCPTATCLRDGMFYAFLVRATNRAGMTSSRQTPTFGLDSTPPVLKQLWDGAAKEDVSLVETSATTLYCQVDAYDYESGVVTVAVALYSGTPDDAQPVLVAAQNVSASPSTHTVVGVDVTWGALKEGDKYFFAVYVINGVGLVSPTVRSSGFEIVQAPTAGYVFDGPTFDDAFFQTGKTTVTARFRGWVSRIIPITHYVWGVRTSDAPGDTRDLQEFTAASISVDDAGNGQVQLPLPLVQGAQYQVVVKSILADASDKLWARSNGIRVHTLSPTAVTVSDGPTRYTSLFPLRYDWNFTDAVLGLDGYAYMLGRVPDDDSFLSLSATGATSVELTPAGASAPLPGQAILLSVRAFGVNGLASGWVRSTGVAVDTTAPFAGAVVCTEAITSLLQPLECSWLGFGDFESTVVSYSLAVGSTVGGSETLFVPSSVLSIEQHYVAYGLNYTNGKTYYAVVIARNGVGLEQSGVSAGTLVDRTAPVAGSVAVVTDKPALFGDDAPATCQLSTRHVTATWGGFSDPDYTDGGIVWYEVAVYGRGPSDPRPITVTRSPVRVGTKTRATVRLPFDLRVNGTYFVSVTAFNRAGLATVAVSNGVTVVAVGQTVKNAYVYDGAGATDIDVQPSAEDYACSWYVEDACGVAEYRWALVRGDGVFVTNYTSTALARSASVYGIQLREAARYYAFVVVVNRLGLESIVSSNGVVVDSVAPTPGRVFDGPTAGVDINFQGSISALSFSWSGFAEPKGRPLAYSVAIGTLTQGVVDDRLKWTDVPASASSFSVTFADTDRLTPLVTYYASVRATNPAGATAIATSDGVKVGIGVAPVAGTVIDGAGGPDAAYQAQTDTLSARWSGFYDPFLPIVRYDWGVFSNAAGLNISDPSSIGTAFDVLNYTSVALNRTATVGGLSLRTGGTVYYAAVRATNDAGLSVVAISSGIVIDPTPPLNGTVNVAASSALGRGVLAFWSDSNLVNVTWAGLVDYESGISEFRVRVFSQPSFGAPAASRSPVTTEVSVPGTRTGHAMVAPLAPGGMYAVQVVAVNGANLTTTVSSEPMLLTTTAPSAGRVFDGAVVAAIDDEYQSTEKSMRFTVLESNVAHDDFCEFRLDSFQFGVSGAWVAMAGQRNGVSYLSDHVGWASGVLFLGVSIDAASVKAGMLESRRSSSEGIFAVRMRVVGAYGLVTSFAAWNSRPGSPGQLDFAPDLSRIPYVQTVRSALDSGLGLLFYGNATGARQEIITWYADAAKRTVAFGRIPLAFDPSVDFHDYQFEIKSLSTYFTVDGVPVQGLAYGPAMDDGMVRLHVLADTLADPNLVRPATKFVNVAEIRTPLDSATRNLCEFAPFADFDAPIAGYEVAVGTKQGLTDVVPFAGIALPSPPYVPCIPAWAPICNATLPKQPHPRTFLLDGLNLPLFQCRDGFRFSDALNTSCHDVDECDEGIDDCHDMANCTNTIGSFLCDCREGLVGSGHGNATGCHSPFATCTDLDCSCNPGYAGDGVVCVDVDECALAAANNATLCDANAVCLNVPGSFKCVCYSGYTGPGTICFPEGSSCAYADELSFAAVNATPGQTVSLRAMGVLDPSAVGLMDVRCTPPDWNATALGALPAQGAVFWYLVRGFGGAMTASMCGGASAPFASLIQVFVACASEQCLSPPVAKTTLCGMHSSVTWTSTSLTNYYVAVRTRGAAVGAFDLSVSGTMPPCSPTCANGGTCIGFNRCACKPGFEGPDCSRQTDACKGAVCHARATCVSIGGKATCSCMAGFAGDGVLSCEDIDECANNSTAACFPNATCVNTVGSFRCVCPPDSVGDGRGDSGCLYRTIPPQPGRYYVGVRGVSASGLRSPVAWSNGVMVDISAPLVTPPTIVNLDSLRKGDLKAIGYHGNATDLGTTWAADDPESGVIAYVWSIGLAPNGTDAYGPATLAVKGKEDYSQRMRASGLALVHNATYFVTVLVVNGARLETVGWSQGVRVDLTPPDASGAFVVTLINGNDANPGGGFILSTADSEMAIRYGGFDEPESFIVYYSWAIGSVPGGEQVQRFISVGTASNTTALRRPVGDALLKRNDTDGLTMGLYAGDVENLSETALRKFHAKFKLEPFRGLWSSIRATNAAGLSSIKSVEEPVVTISPADTVVSQPGPVVLTLSSGEPSAAVVTLAVDADDRVAGAPLVVGAITHERLTQDYTSGADSGRFLQSPDRAPATFGYMTVYLNVSFALSKTANSVLVSTLVDTSFMSTLLLDEDVMLLQFDVETMTWGPAYLSCPPDVRERSFDRISGKLTVRICPPNTAGTAPASPSASPSDFGSASPPVPSADPSATVAPPSPSPVDGVSPSASLIAPETPGAPDASPVPTPGGRRRRAVANFDQAIFRQYAVVGSKRAPASSSSGLSSGAIAGIVIGTVGACLAAAVAGFVVYRRRHTGDYGLKVEERIRTASMVRQTRTDVHIVNPLYARTMSTESVAEAVKPVDLTPAHMKEFVGRGESIFDRRTRSPRPAGTKPTEALPVAAGPSGLAADTAVAALALAQAPVLSPATEEVEMQPMTAASSTEDVHPQPAPEQPVVEPARAPTPPPVASELLKAVAMAPAPEPDDDSEDTAPEGSTGEYHTAEFHTPMGGSGISNDDESDESSEGQISSEGVADTPESKTRGEALLARERAAADDFAYSRRAVGLNTKWSTVRARKEKARGAVSQQTASSDSDPAEEAKAEKARMIAAVDDFALSRRGVGLNTKWNTRREKKKAVRAAIDSSAGTSQAGPSTSVFESLSTVDDVADAPLSGTSREKLREKAHADVEGFAKGKSKKARPSSEHTVDLTENRMAGAKGQ